MANQKRILLIDLGDRRRDTRVQLLTHAGYAVEVRNNHIEAEHLDHEGEFDLVIVTLHGSPQKAVKYSDDLNRAKPRLPILLLTDSGVYVPGGTRNQSMETGSPGALIEEIASMLEGSTHIRESPFQAGS